MKNRARQKLLAQAVAKSGMSERLTRERRGARALRSETRKPCDWWTQVDAFGEV